MAGRRDGQRLSDMPPTAVASWCDTLGGVLPARTKTALSERILEEGLDAHSFSIALNQHVLCDWHIQGMTGALAQKVRRCWHKDFPGSASIQPVNQPPMRPSTVPMDDGLSPSAPSPGGYESTQPVPAEDFSYGGVLELLRASLDCVAERAGLDRKEVYLWVHSAIPNEIWQPLWDTVTADMLRQQEQASVVYTPPSSPVPFAARVPPVPPAIPAAQSVLSGRSYTQAQSQVGPPSPAPQSRARPSSAGAIRQSREPGEIARSHLGVRQSFDPSSASRPPSVIARSQVAPSQIDERMEHLPNLRSSEGLRAFNLRSARSMSPGSRSNAARSVAERSVAQRSEAESIVSQAMSAWLEGDSAPQLTPMELVDWLRLLPSNKVSSETKKAVARRVLDQDMDGQDFQEIVKGGGWAALDVHDEREAAALTRLFKQKQQEKTMAEAARETGKLNRDLKGMRGQAMDL